MAPATDAAASDSFIHAARREQVVRSAIALIAELGAAHASVVKIARHAGVSRGVVTYHFRDADDLTDAVVDEVYRVGADRLRAPVADAPTPRDAVLTFVGGSVEFYAEYPQHIAALQEIFTVRRRSAVRSRGATAHHARELDELGALLQAGQDAGQFRPFDVAVMADAVRAVLDSAVRRLREGTSEAPALRDELVHTVGLMIGAR